MKNPGHKDYVDVLFNEKITRHKMKRFWSKSHRIGTYDVCKIFFLALMIKDAY